MKKNEIERIIKKGSTRQKIKLYFTDIAYFNTKGISSVEIRGSGEDATLERKDAILNERERTLILDSITGTRDISYYEDLRAWNRAFLMFKPNINTYSGGFSFLISQIRLHTTSMLLHSIYEEAINDILTAAQKQQKTTLDEVVNEAKSIKKTLVESVIGGALKNIRETLVGTATESLKVLKAKRYQEGGYPPYIEIPDARVWGKVWLSVEMINEQAEEAKEYIETIKEFLNQNLPLQPYRDFVKGEEQKIIERIEEGRAIIDAFLCAYLDLKPEPNIIELLKEEGAEDIEKMEIKRYEDINIEINSEDIEDIKNAGI